MLKQLELHLIVVQVLLELVKEFVEMRQFE